MSSPRFVISPSRWDQVLLAGMIRHVAVIGIAGVITGVLVGGIGGRVFMRLSALIAPDRAVGAITENGAVVGEITFGGTVAFFLFIGVFSGAVGAVIYTIAEPWLAWAGTLRGVVFGMFLLATTSTVVLDPENFDFAILGKDPRNVIMLIVLYVAFGAVLVGLQRALEGRLPAVDEHRPIDSIPVYIAMVMLGSVFLLLILANQFLEPVCECDPPRLTGVFIIGMALSTAAYRLNELTGSTALSSRSIRIAGYLSTAGAFTAGAARAISDIQQLL